tara:strand:- start:331 stop:540 length:210 start_codon:yes stop_codon:yes gene_type:complete
MMINAFNSTALDSVALDGDRVTVTFNGGRAYTYTVADVQRFVLAFNTAESKGKFMNQQIQSETLQTVTV